MSNQKAVFNNSIEHFASDQEAIRSAAAFAAGKRTLSTLAVTTELALMDDRERRYLQLATILACNR
jgi:gamma-glutamyltranspeptidase